MGASKRCGYDVFEEGDLVSAGINGARPKGAGKGMARLYLSGKEDGRPGAREAIAMRDEQALRRHVEEAQSWGSLREGRGPKRWEGSKDWLALAAADGWEDGVRILLPVSDIGRSAPVDWSSFPHAPMESGEIKRSQAKLAGKPWGGSFLLDKHGNARNKLGAGTRATALGLACVNGHIGCARILRQAWEGEQSGPLPRLALSTRVDPRNDGEKEPIDASGDEPAIDWAARSGSEEITKVLLAIGEDRWLNRAGQEGALLAAFGDKDFEPRREALNVLMRLVQAGANVEERSSRASSMGMTPLGVAASRGWRSVAKMLMENGASSMVNDSHGRGVLMLALAGSGGHGGDLGAERYARAEMAIALLAAGADPGAEPRRWGGGMATPLMVAIGQGNERAAAAIEDALAKKGIYGAREAAVKSLGDQDLWNDYGFEGEASGLDDEDWLQEDWSDGRSGAQDELGGLRRKMEEARSGLGAIARQTKDVKKASKRHRLAKKAMVGAGGPFY